jgi:hypothetical protein
MRLRQFQRVVSPLTAAEIKKITGINYAFLSVMFGLDSESGAAIRKAIHDRATAPSTPSRT